jgi:L-lysine 2,3-aminomutase
MHDSGLILYNQTVFLKGINDNASILYDLFSMLSIHGVRPYYLFQCRPVIGSLHQQVPLVDGIKIFNKLAENLTGLHKPYFAMSTKVGKLQIVGVSPVNENIVVLRKHSSKNVSKTGELIFYDVSKEDPFWYYA